MEITRRFHNEDREYDCILAGCYRPARVGADKQQPWRSERTEFRRWSIGISRKQEWPSRERYRRFQFVNEPGKHGSAAGFLEDTGHAGKQEWSTCKAAVSLANSIYPDWCPRRGGAVCCAIDRATGIAKRWATGIAPCRRFRRTRPA
jgi:hypothetical protein